MVWLLVSVGGFIGGFLTTMFGASAFSLSSITGSTIGSIIGIWAYAKLFSK